MSTSPFGVRGFASAFLAPKSGIPAPAFATNLTSPSSCKGPPVPIVFNPL